MATTGTLCIFALEPRGKKMQEIEAKILEIDKAAIVAKLKALGASFDFEDEFFAIYYDDSDNRLANAQQVLRIRKEGKDVRLTFKAPHEGVQGGIGTREELELPIGDFEMMRTILGRLGYVEYLKMRKIRTQYSLHGTHIVVDAHIDDLAFVPPYLEIEAPSHDAMFEMASLLGFKQEQLIDWNAARVVEWYRGKG
jgi:adenylate cyclase, class 2